MSIIPRGLMEKKRLPIPKFGDLWCSCVKGNDTSPANNINIEFTISEDSISGYDMVCASNT